MSKIKVITDSTSDIPKDLAEKMNIDIVPLNIFFGDEKYKDGINITAEDVYKRIQSQKKPWPTTSQPTAKEFLKYYNKAFDEGYETVISIHITPNMSGTLNSVNLAKQMLPDKDLVIVDSNSVTHPLGLLTYETAKLANNGTTKDEILDVLKNKFRNKNNICGVVDSLEYLHRGGRIGRAKRVLGTLLKKKPLLEMVDGTINSFGSVTGHEDALNNLVQMMSKVFDNLITDEVWLGYADMKDYTKHVYDEIKDLPNAPAKLRVLEIGPAVGVHLGPGCMTASWIGDWNNKWFFGKE